MTKTTTNFRNTVLHGDCIDIMRSMTARSVDFILTDPPYLVRYCSRDGRRIANDRTAEWLLPASKQMYRVLKANSLCISFYGWTKADQFIGAWREAGFRIVGHVVFAKRYASTARFVEYRHESAYVLAKGQPALPHKPPADVIDWVYTGNRLHPTQKSIKILKPFIKAFCPRSGVVLDPFCGSGSTLAAARKLGRDYIGIELDETYHRIASDRMAA